MQGRLISVIIPTYNEVNSIDKLLTHLMRVPNIEIIVSDGGSKDGTDMLCEKYPIIFINSPLGRGNQLNAGVKKAKGDIFLFLHADSDFDDTVLDDIRGAIKTGSRWGCCTIEFQDSSVPYIILAFFSNLRANIFSSCYGDQGIYCESHIFHEIGGFQAIPILEDLEFSKRVKKLSKAKVIKSKIFTSPRRFQQGGFMKTLIKMQIIKLFYYWGISPEKLKKIYR